MLYECKTSLLTSLLFYLLQVCSKQLSSESSALLWCCGGSSSCLSSCPGIYAALLSVLPS